MQTHLQFLGRLQVDGRMQVIVDMSGVIQKTLLEAHQDREAWRPFRAKRRFAWLRQVFSNNLQENENSTSRVNERLAAEFSSPSSQCDKEHETLRLARALDQLLANQRFAVEMYHLAGLPLADVAEHLQRSQEDAALQAYRGVIRLRHLLADPDEE